MPALPNRLASFVQVDKDGQVLAGGGAKAGEVGASVQGMVDLSADGGLQAVGASPTVEGGGAKIGVNGGVQLRRREGPVAGTWARRGRTARA